MIALDAARTFARSMINILFDVIALSLLNRVFLGIIR